MASSARGRSENVGDIISLDVSDAEEDPERRGVQAGLAGDSMLSQVTHADLTSPSTDQSTITLFVTLPGDVSPSYQHVQHDVMSNVRSDLAKALRALSCQHARRRENRNIQLSIFRELPLYCDHRSFLCRCGFYAVGNTNAFQDCEVSEVSEHDMRSCLEDRQIMQTARVVKFDEWSYRLLYIYIYFLICFCFINITV